MSSCKSHKSQNAEDGASKKNHQRKNTQKLTFEKFDVKKTNKEQKKGQKVPPHNAHDSNSSSCRKKLKKGNRKKCAFCLGKKMQLQCQNFKKT